MELGMMNLGYPGMAPGIGAPNAFAAGLQAGLRSQTMARADGFMGSPGLMEGRGGPLGGLGCGFGNPMMGLGGLAGANPDQLKGMLMTLLSALMTQQGQGMGGPGLGGPCGMPGAMPGGPGGMPGGMPFGPGPGGPPGMGGPAGVGAPGMGQPQTIELQPGQTFTTPGGCTIHWDKKDKDSVKISEPGGGGGAAGGAGKAGCAKGGGGAKAQASAGPGGAQASASAGGAGRAFGTSMALSAAGQMGNQSFAMAFAASMGGGGGPCGCVGAQQGEQQAPRNWKVWGDPHIDHPNGKKSDFEKKNAMFTLTDGTKVLMGADNPKGVVQRVQVILPGGQPNWNGFDPKQTSIMQDQGGMFKPIGTADQFMGGGYGRL